MMPSSWVWKEKKKVLAPAILILGLLLRMRRMYVASIRLHFH